MCDSDGYILSSACPLSRSLVAFASRVGGVLDPHFLLHCRIVDPDLQKKIDQLKQVPLSYGSSSATAYPHQEELFLDMDSSGHHQFHDPWQFRQHNPWFNNRSHWDACYYDNQDIVIDPL